MNQDIHGLIIFVAISALVAGVGWLISPERDIWLKKRNHKKSLDELGKLDKIIEDGEK